MHTQFNMANVNDTDEVADLELYERVLKWTIKRT